MKELILLTEYRADPVGLQTAAPRFCWRYPADPGRQLSYRVGVASSREGAEAGDFDLWDSGEVPGETCFGVTYAGKPLSSRAVGFVRAETVCEKGVFQSPVGSFEIGLLKQSDWKGKWVSVPVNFQGGTLLVRKRFQVEKPVRRARAYVCGLGYHECFLNGQKLGEARLNPGVTAYDKRVLYCTYDLIGLKQGDNVFGAEVGYGWLGARKLLVQIYIDFEDGSCYEDHTANGWGWWVGGSPTLENSIYGGEVYDARVEEKFPLNWSAPDFEPTWANGWMYPLLVEAPGGAPEAQTNEIRVLGQFPEIARKTLADGSIVIDVGQNLAGWARIRVKGERGARITLRYAEGLKPDGSVNQLNLRSARCADTYVLKGGEEEEWAPRFTYHGFRYVQAEIEGRAELLSLTAEYVHTEVRPAGSFECSDEVLNQLHRNAVFTETNNIHSVLTDCPQRDERFGWLNDLSARLYQTVCNFGMECFFPKFVRDITDTMDEQGGIADTAPYFTGGRPADPVSAAYLLMPRMAHRLYGDASVAEREFEGLKKWVDFLLTRSKDFIMDYSYYGDWVPPACFADVATDPLYVSSVYLFWQLRLLSELAGIAGRQEEAARYADLTEQAKKALNRAYYHAESHTYAGGTQAENSLALSLGLCPPGEAAEVAAKIAADAVQRGHHSTCGNVGYRHLFYVLADYGYADEVLAILRNPEYPGWGYMIANGATTVWERWEAEMQNEMHSFDHPMFGSYDAWFYRYLAGIGVQDEAVACDRLILDPRFPQSLSFVRASFETLRGKVCSSWQREADGSVTLTVTIPPTASALANVRGLLNGKPFEGGILGPGTWRITQAEEGPATVFKQT